MKKLIVLLLITGCATAPLTSLQRQIGKEKGWTEAELIAAVEADNALPCGKRKMVYMHECIAAPNRKVAAPSTDKSVPIIICQAGRSSDPRSICR
jgi:hypothetical protein